MKVLSILLVLALVVGVVGAGFAEEAVAIPTVSPEALEGWFFHFLERLLNLFADFIGRILGDIFGGIGGLFGGGDAVRT